MRFFISVMNVCRAWIINMVFLFLHFEIPIHMRLCLMVVFLLFCYESGGQTPDSLAEIRLNTEVVLSSRNIWRGLDYGSSPSIQGTLAVRKNAFEIGAFGTTTLNGSKEGFGTWMELFASAYWRNWSFTVDDYFFFNANDTDNNYFDWSRSATQHILEARVKYASPRFSVMTGYAFYKNRMDRTSGIYVEAEYFFTENFSFLIGGLTDESWLSFYRKGGVTTVGFTGRRLIKFSDNFSAQLKASLVGNPSYDRSVNAPGVGTNPVYFVVSIGF